MASRSAPRASQFSGRDTAGDRDGARGAAPAARAAAARAAAMRKGLSQQGVPIDSILYHAPARREDGGVHREEGADLNDVARVSLCVPGHLDAAGGEPARGLLDLPGTAACNGVHAVAVL